MKRDTIRHARMRGRRANLWIKTLKGQIPESDTTTLYFTITREKGSPLYKCISLNAGMAIKRY